MPDTVHVPVIGQMNKGVAVAGGLAAVTVGSYLIYKHLKKKSTASTTATAGQYGYGQYAYGQYGYGQQYAYGSEPYGYGAYTYDGGYGPGGSGGIVTGGGGLPYGYGAYYGYSSQAAATTNAQWSANAVQILSGEGYNATTVLAALGLYLTGGSLSPQQAQIVQAAISAEGNPPTPGPNGYPPAINQGGGGGGSGQQSGQPVTTGNGTGATNNVKIPQLKGQTAGNAHNALVVAGLHPIADTGQKATDIVSSTNPAAGKSVPEGSTVVIVASPKK